MVKRRQWLRIHCQRDQSLRYKLKQVDKNKPKSGRGRTGMQCKKPQPVADTLVSTSKSPKIPTIQRCAKDNLDFTVPEQLIANETETITRRKIQGKNREQPFHPDPIYRLLPKPPDNLWPESPETNTVTKPKMDIEFEENSPHQEGIISEFYQRPDKTYFQEPKNFRKFSKHQQPCTKIFTKTNWYI